MAFGKLGSKGGFGSLGVLGRAGGSAPLSYRVIATTGGNRVDTAGTDVTTNVQLDLRISMRSPKAAVSNLKLLLTGRIQDTSLHSTKAGPADFTVEAASEISGVNTRFTKSASNQMAVLATDTQVPSDVNGVTLPANTSWFLRASQRVASLGTHMTRPYNAGATYLIRNSFNNNAGNQVAGTGAITTTNEAVTAWAPLAIIGVAQGSMTSVAWIGTSIDGGTGDASPNANGNVGYWNKALDALSNYIPGLGLSHPSSLVSEFINADGRGDFDRSLYQYADAILMGAWTNDFATGNRTLAAVQADVLTVINGNGGSIIGAKAAGPDGKVRKVYAATMLPRTTSTDSFLTPGNQTPLANGFVGGTVGTSANRRNDYNIWLESLCDAGTIDGLIDLNAGRYKLTGGSWVAVSGGVEDQSNLGKWVTDGSTTFLNTGDGTHPNAHGVTLMTPVVTALAVALGW